MKQVIIKQELIEVILYIQAKTDSIQWIIENYNRSNRIYKWTVNSKHQDILLNDLTVVTQTNYGTKSLDIK